MAKSTGKLKTVFIGSFLWICVISFVLVWLHFGAEHRQAQREIIYMKARQQAAADKRQRVLEYEKRRQEQTLSRQYRQGRVEKTVPSR